MCLSRLLTKRDSKSKKSSFGLTKCIFAFDKMKKLMAADAIIAYPWVHKRWVGACGVSGNFESSQNKARVYVVAMNAIVLLR